MISQDNPDRHIKQLPFGNGIQSVADVHSFPVNTNPANCMEVGISLFPNSSHISNLRCGTGHIHYTILKVYNTRPYMIM